MAYQAVQPTDIVSRRALYLGVADYNMLKSDQRKIETANNIWYPKAKTHLRYYAKLNNEWCLVFWSKS